MTSTLIVIADKVNSPQALDDCQNNRLAYDVAVKTLADRINWILAERKLSGRELSRRAGFKSEAMISVIQHRLRNHPDAGVGHDTLVALARAGGVSVDWLATGAGLPNDGATAPLSADDASLVQLEAIPGWSKLVAGARALAPDIQPWVWEYIARKRVVVTEHPTPAELVAVARVVMQFVPPP